jgi:hypothetical protein
MPDRKTLKIGDRIRILVVPEMDLQQRDRELREGAEEAGWTADTIEKIICQDPIVTIDEIDEYGYPWFRYDLKIASGEVEIHHLAIMEDESWELVDDSNRESTGLTPDGGEQ